MSTLKGCAHEFRYLKGPEVSNSSELELQVVTNHLTLVLGTKTQVPV